MQQMHAKDGSSRLCGTRIESKQSGRRLHLEVLEDRLAPANAIWIAPTAGNWSNPVNWSTGTVPQSSDVAIFSTGLGGSASNVFVNSNVSVGSIQCDFTYTGGLTVNNGISLTAGSFNHYGALTLNSNSTLTVNGTFLEYGTLNVSANNVVINAGQMQIISGGVPTSNGSLSLIATAPTSTPNLTINGALIAAGPMTIGDGGTAAWMHVNGTLEIQGPAPPTVINLTSQLSYNGTAAAEIFNLTLNQGIFTTTAGANLSGTLLCTGANGGLFQGNLQNAGGTITFSGGSVSGLLVTGNFSQFLGTLQFRVMGINVADGLLVLGNTTVSGTLEVSDPFTSRIPVVSSYVIIRASTLTLSSPTIALPDSTWIWFQFLQDLVVT